MKKSLLVAVCVVFGTAVVATQWYMALSIRALSHRMDVTERSNRMPEAPAPLPTQPLSLRGAPTKGSWSARLALIEYSDFKCPYCAAFSRQTLPLLEQEYVQTGKVLLAFRHLPLRDLHPTAPDASRAAECAKQQNQFWPMHNWLFQNPKNEAYSEGATSVGIEPARFASCMSDSHVPSITADVTSADQLKIVGTPTFFLGSLRSDGTMIAQERIRGAVSLDRFRQSIDKALGGS